MTPFKCMWNVQYTIPEHYPIWLKVYVWFYVRLESYGSAYVGLQHRRMYQKLPQESSLAFRLCSKLEFAIRDHVRGLQKQYKKVY